MKSISYLMLAVLAFLSTGLRAYEENVPIKKVRVKVNQLSVRVGPDTKFYRLGFYNRDEVLNVYGEENGWYKTDCPKDTNVYIYQKFIKVNGNDGEIIGDRVNARSGGSEDSVVLFVFNNKTKVSVLGVSGDWVKIAPPALAFGYILGDEKFLEVLGGGGLVINSNSAPKSNVVIDENENVTTPTENTNDSTVEVLDNGGSSTVPLDQDALELLRKRQEAIDKIKRDAQLNAGKILSPKEEDYVFKGWVGRLGRVIGRKATHSLYLVENQDLCHMISNNPDIKLEDYAGKYVGIKGEELGQEKRSKVNLIGVTEIVVFDKNPDATGLGK